MPVRQKTKYPMPNIKIEVDKKGLVGHSGLSTLIQTFSNSPLGDELSKCLPEDGSNRSFGNYDLALLLIASLCTGHDSLDDIEEFEDEDLIEILFKRKTPTSKTLGNFLRRFEDHHVDSLKEFLTKMGYTLREHSKKVHPHKGDTIPHFKIDGTHHEQHGKKIEGTGWMVTSRDKSVFGLASQTVFDELGFSYAGELLPAKHPKGNASALIEQVVSPLKNKKIDSPFKKLFRLSGDSAYLTESVIRAVTSQNGIFNIAAPRTINWHQHLDTREWCKWDFDTNNTNKRKKTKITETLLSRWHWSPKWSKGKLKFPVIIKKEWREDELFGDSCGSYHYHAVATNEDLFQKDYQHVIEHYRPRADVENMIKEFKLNFDAKHLPCLSFRANEVYFLFVLIAQNLIRWVALLEQPDKPKFAKKIRRYFITSPGRILKGSRQITLRVKKKFYKEVNRLIEAWRSQPIIVPLKLSSA